MPENWLQGGIDAVGSLFESSEDTTTEDAIKRRNSQFDYDSGVLTDKEMKTKWPARFKVPEGYWDENPWEYKPGPSLLGKANAMPLGYGSNNDTDTDLNISRAAPGEAFGRATIMEGVDKLNRGPGQGYIQSVEGLMAQGGDANQAQQAFAEAQNLAPANMGAYYDRAGEQAIQGIDKQAASRGVYGSSAAQELGQSTLTDLAAQRSLQEAQYGLSRADMMGRLGQGAATSQQAALGTVAGSEQQRRGMEFEVLRGLADMGIAVDQSRLNRILGLFDANIGMAGAQSGIIGAADAAAFSEAERGLEQEVGAGLGRSAYDVSIAEAEVGDTQEMADNIEALYGDASDAFAANQ